MKNILLSVMVICTLIGGALAGTLADFSDIEVSKDNFFATGSLDLKVSDYQGREYNGDTIPAFIQYSDAWPCSDKSFYIDLENWGQGAEFIPYAYVHFKNLECGWVVPKNTYAWIDCDPDTGECIVIPRADWPDLPVGTHGTGLPKPVTEPEYVAECGGIAGENATGQPVEVPGIGCCFGEDCQLAAHIGVKIWVAGPWPHEDKPAYNEVPMGAWELVFDGKLSELNCTEFELGQIPNCNGIWVHVSFHLQELSEEDAHDLGLIPTTYFDETIPAELKWNDWPTNALQKDYVEFDMSFELLQTPLP